MWVLKYIIVPVTCSLEKKRKKNQICHYSECVVIYLAGGQGGSKLTIKRKGSGETHTLESLKKDLPEGK